MTSTDAPRAVIFDLDGVLADSEGLHAVAWERLFDREGVTVTEAECEHGIGMTDVAWVRWLFERRGQDADPRWWQDAKRAIYGELLAANVRTFPGVPELVRRLAEEFRLGVASSSWREDIETVVRGLGLDDCFQSFVGKQDVERHKPDPQAYLLSAQRLGARPAACTVIEDSALGIQAAKAAGMRCIAVTTSLPAHRLGDADLVLDSLDDPDPVVRLARGGRASAS